MIHGIFNFISLNTQINTKHIWNYDIPSSRTFTFQILFHNKIETDENLIIIGFSFPSTSILCKLDQESSINLFFQRSLSTRILNQFFSLVGKSTVHNNIYHILVTYLGIHYFYYQQQLAYKESSSLRQSKFSFENISQLHSC